MTETLTLSFFAFLAGFVDSIAGGGGLIQLPALFIVLPAAPAGLLLGTNKFSSICGTAVAALQYARHTDIDWKATAPATLAAFLCSFLGARAAVSLQSQVMRPMVLFLLAGVLVYTFLQRDFGTLHAPKLERLPKFFCGIATGMALGFYDGFFGPGTGSFLIFIFIGIFGFSFLSASASSKVVNLMTNLAAVIYFMATSNVLYRIAIPMAACNIAGSIIGTRLAVLKGNRFVRAFFLLVVGAMIVKLGIDTFR